MSFYSDNVEKMIIIRSITTIIYACIFLFIKYKQKNIPIEVCPLLLISFLSILLLLSTYYIIRDNWPTDNKNSDDLETFNTVFFYLSIGIPIVCIGLLYIKK